jgi:hypothetical protein
MPEAASSSSRAGPLGPVEGEGSNQTCVAKRLFKTSKNHEEAAALHISDWILRYDRALKLVSAALEDDASQSVFQIGNYFIAEVI